MKITVYTITDCQFSKQEKEYLKSHNLPFEEKNLELNKEWLTEMMAVSNNFAGTPVTRVEKDDGTIRVFKGFTKEEFDEFFGFTSEQNQKPPPAPQDSQTQVDSKLNDVLNKLEEKTENQTQTSSPDLNQPEPVVSEPIFESITEPVAENNLPAEETKPENPLDSPPSNIPQIPDLPSDLKN